MNKKFWYRPWLLRDRNVGPSKPKHIVVFSGAGISAESGLPTFRDNDGLWQNHSFHQLASIQGWRQDREIMLEFYNQRRQQVRAAQPNVAHYALVELAKYFRVSIITQNVDDLHERAGSENALHLHGEILKARSSVNSKLVYPLDDNDIHIGDRCERGSQLRPHVVWFGERVTEFPKAIKLVKQADVLLVVGTSLSVYPAANLIDYVKLQTPLYLVSPEVEHVPMNCHWFQKLACECVPELIREWIEDLQTK